MNTLPNIVLAGLNRYQNPAPKKVITREQQIERLLNRYASAVLTFRKPETWKVWAKERDAIIAEAGKLIGKNYNGNNVVTIWEHETPKDELDYIVAKEYHTWSNNPCRPWNSGDSEHLENRVVFDIAFLAKKKCYHIYYDHS